MKLTKIDVAEAHLISAVRLHFQCGHPASVYLLAASAREILTTIGDKTGIRTMLHGLAEATGKSLKEVVNAANEHTNFLKHADRDPSAVLEGLTDAGVDVLLFIACHDFGRVAKGQAVEMQVYEVWWLARHWPTISKAPLRLQPALRRIRRHHARLPFLPRIDGQLLGGTMLRDALENPALRMQINRDVVLPSPAPLATKKR